MAKRRAWVVAIQSAAAIFVACLVAGWLVVQFEPFRHAALSFEAPQSCAADVTKGFGKGGFASRWEGDDFVIRGSSCANCAKAIESVSAQAVGGFVLLKINFSSPEMRAACNCQHRVVAKLSKLPKADYRVVRVDRLLPESMGCE
jgi:hypothetical protein